MNDKDELVDAAIKHAEAVIAVKRAQRKFQEAMTVAHSIRDNELGPAERHLLRMRTQLDRLVDGINATDLVVQGRVA